MYKVSVIVPIYNSERYLKKCIDSILDQTYSNIEIILVDDGSLDESLSICNNYKEMDLRVKVFHIENSGVSAARNIGIQNSTGDFITFVDSDDWIATNFIDEAINYIDKYSLDIFIGGFFITDIDSKIISSQMINNTIIVENRLLNPNEKQILLDKNYISGSCGKIYSSSVIKNNRFDDSFCCGEDLKFVFNVISCSNSIMAVHDCYYYYRNNLESITHTVTLQKCECVKKIAEFLLDDYYHYCNFDSEYGEYLNYRYMYDCKFNFIIIGKIKAPLLSKYKMIRELLDSSELKRFSKNCRIKVKWFSFNPFICLAYSILKTLK